MLTSLKYASNLCYALLLLASGSSSMSNTFLLLLQDVLALLAYDEPEKSPMFYYLSADYRHQVADSLNRAILGLFFVLYLFQNPNFLCYIYCDLKSLYCQNLFSFLLFLIIVSTCKSA